MGAESRIVKGKNGRPLAGEVRSFYLDPAAVAHVKVINYGRTVVLFLRGWQPPIHVHCAEVIATVGREGGSETDLVCKIVRAMQSSQKNVLEGLCLRFKKDDCADGGLRSPPL